MGLVLRDRLTRRAPGLTSTGECWVDREAAGCEFRDARLGKRFRQLFALGSAMGQSIPLICQDWANTKAAYRFFSNDRVSEADILAGHFQSTRDRVAATDGLVLVLHDTTEFTYQRERSEAIGITKNINSGKDKTGRLRSHTVCDILMHSSLRQQPRGCLSDKGQVVPTEATLSLPDQDRTARRLPGTRQ